MTSLFKVHNINISVKFETPTLMYFNNLITKIKAKNKLKHFDRFHIVYSNATYIFIMQQLIFYIAT